MNNRKQTLVVLVTILGLFAPVSYGRNLLEFGKIIRIEVPDKGEDFEHGKSNVNKLKRENRALRKRVIKLELAVRQIQEALTARRYERAYPYQRYVPTPAPVKKGAAWTCMITTSFKGTFSGEGHTQLAAKSKALKACETGGGSFCDRKVKCEKAE